jgi:hypothetical protein
MPRQKKAKKAGRPPLPKGHAKAGTLRVRVTPEELRTIEAEAKNRKQTVSEWIREVVMGRNVKTWYAFCPDNLHIALFEKPPGQKNFCLGCRGIRELHGVAEGYVSKDEADNGLAHSEPLSNPDSPIPPKRL